MKVCFSTKKSQHIVPELDARANNTSELDQVISLILHLGADCAMSLGWTLPC